jgi:hypothetical protein
VEVRLTIEQQDKTPGAHAAKPSPSPRPTPMLAELETRHAEARKQVQDWLADNFVQAPFDPSLGEFEVRVDVEPDLESQPSDEYDRAAKVLFREHRWWYSKAVLEIWVVPNQGSDRTASKDPVRVARVEQPGCAEGDVPREGFVGAWEGDYRWMRLLNEAVTKANDLLALLKSDYLLSAEPVDPHQPLTPPTPGEGFSTTPSGAS